MSKKGFAATAGISALLLAYSAVFAQTLTIATVDNSDMVIMQKLSAQFSQASGIELDWVVMDKASIRLQ